jgi:aminopeptidase-like protein
MSKPNFQEGIEVAKRVSILYPQNRSIVGPGIKRAFQYLASTFTSRPEYLKFRTGSTFGTWRVPQAWELHQASITCNTTGKTIITSKDSNLHVWSHSIPIDLVISRKELDNHVRTNPELPEAIPYVTAYYSSTWGFSLQHNKLLQMCSGNFHVKIESDLWDDSLEIMEVVIPGRSKTEVFFSTYLCHPSMVVNELIAPSLAAELIKWLEKRENIYTYRFVFLPETIGSVIYSKKFLRNSKRRILHAFNLTCLGGSDEWNVLPTKKGNTYTDFVTKTFMLDRGMNFTTHNFKSRGSDERQYSNPNIELPILSIMRSKYHNFPEYHTSLDDLRFNLPERHQETFDFYIDLIQFIEADQQISCKDVGEPFLNGIFRNNDLGGQKHKEAANKNDLLDFLIQCDSSSFAEIIARTEMSIELGMELLTLCLKHNLIECEPLKPKKLREMQI